MQEEVTQKMIIPGFFDEYSDRNKHPFRKF